MSRESLNDELAASTNPDVIEIDISSADEVDKSKKLWYWRDHFHYERGGDFRSRYNMLAAAKLRVQKLAKGGRLSPKQEAYQVNEITSEQDSQRRQARRRFGPNEATVFNFLNSDTDNETIPEYYIDEGDMELLRKYDIRGRQQLLDCLTAFRVPIQLLQRSVEELEDLDARVFSTA